MSQASIATTSWTKGLELGSKIARMVAVAALALSTTVGLVGSLAANVNAPGQEVAHLSALGVDLSPTSGGLKAKSNEHFQAVNWPKAAALLSNLKTLRSLDLTDSQVEDLGPIRALTALRSLSLYGTRVSDLGPLKGLASLQSLVLANTNVENLAPLNGLTGLQELYLETTGVADIGPLGGLSSLKVLHLSWTRVADLNRWRACARSKSSI